jgi:hypothetical protein
MVAVFLTQIVNDAILADPSEDHKDVASYFGDICSSMLTLYASIADGTEWLEPAHPLMKKTSPASIVVYVLYVTFVVFALMNLFTGIFVDKALENGRTEKRRLLLEELQAIFIESDQVQASGKVAWENIQEHLTDEHFLSVLEAIDVDEADAEELFHLLDTSNEGEIEIEDFVNGCLSLEGPAQAIDLAAFVKETRDINHKWIQQGLFMNESLEHLKMQLAHLTKHSPDPIMEPTPDFSGMSGKHILHHPQTRLGTKVSI